MSLYEATDGINWQRNSGWGEGDPCTLPTWQRVTCTIDDRFVLLLTLGFNRLSGTLPRNLGGLHALFEFSVSRNHLSGEIPVELLNVRTIEVLDLSGNMLEGEVPPELLQLEALGIGALNLSFNALYSSNPELDAFINSRSPDDWKATQTIAPEGLQAQRLVDGSVELSWQPIEFSEFPGRYRLELSTTSGGPYEAASSTPDKVTARLVLDGLDETTTYYGVVYTETDPHENNPNKVVSRPSAEIAFQPAELGSVFAINEGLNGSWFNSDTLGQGFFIDIFPLRGEVFVAWFTYDTEAGFGDVVSVVGHPGHRWLTAQGPFSGTTADLTVNVTRGGIFNDPAGVETTPVGSMQLEFEDCENAVITYELGTPPLSGQVPLTRISNSNAELCRALAGVN